MARTKQTACKTDTTGRLTEATFDEPDSTMDKPTTSQALQDQPDQPDQPDIDPTDTQPATRNQEQAVKDAVAKVHDATLQACDSLKVVHQSLCKLRKVAPLDLYLKVVREQQIPNVNVVINVTQSASTANSW